MHIFIENLCRGQVSTAGHRLEPTIQQIRSSGAKNHLQRKMIRPHHKIKFFDLDHRSRGAENLDENIVFGNDHDR
jgi:hypothetical protein